MPAIAIDLLGFFVNGVLTILFSLDLMEATFSCVSEPLLTVNPARSGLGGAPGGGA